MSTTSFHGCDPCASDNHGKINLGKHVWSADLHIVKMACEAVLLAFTLVLGFKCWQVCASRSCVPLTGVYPSPEHGFCHNLRPNAIVQDDDAHPQSQDYQST